MADLKYWEKKDIEDILLLSTRQSWEKPSDVPLWRDSVLQIAKEEGMDVREVTKDLVVALYYNLGQREFKVPGSVFISRINDLQAKKARAKQVSINEIVLKLLRKKGTALNYLEIVKITGQYNQPVQGAIRELERRGILKYQLEDRVMRKYYERGIYGIPPRVYVTRMKPKYLKVPHMSESGRDLLQVIKSTVREINLKNSLGIGRLSWEFEHKPGVFYLMSRPWVKYKQQWASKKMKVVSMSWWMKHLEGLPVVIPIEDIKSEFIKSVLRRIK
jgi:hypothetical protein